MNSIMKVQMMTDYNENIIYTTICVMKVITYKVMLWYIVRLEQVIENHLFFLSRGDFFIEKVIVCIDCRVYKKIFKDVFV